MLRRAARTVALGVLLGVGVSAGWVARAQAYGEPVALVTALQAAALAADVDLVVAGVPIVDVWLPVTSSDWRGVLFGLASSYGLTVCELDGGTVLVTDSPVGVGVCGKSAEAGERSDVTTEAAAELGAAVVGPVEEVEEAEELTEVVASSDEAVEEPVVRSPLVYRVRVLQLDEARAVDLGLDWSGGVFETAAALVAGGVAVSNGVFPVAEMGKLVRFLESEGVARRLDDVELRSLAGVPVQFNRGGSISVNLVGGGDSSISRQFQYGLGLELEGSLADQVVELRYSFTDSAPGNVSDPSNVQIASTTSSSVLQVPCGHSVVVASMGSSRSGLQGAGLPALSAVPVVGYAFGSGGVVESRMSFVVTVDVGCVL